MDDHLDPLEGTALKPAPSIRGEMIARRLLLPLLLLAAAVILVFYIFFDSVQVDGDSMDPTLLSGDRLLITKEYKKPERGDIVVTRHDVRAFGEEGIVKRVLALSGDTVSVTGDVVYVNGKREPKRDLIFDSRDPADVADYLVPAGYVFLVGDNRPSSFDSRMYGAVSLDVIDGRAVAVWAPIDRLRLIR